jgi:hypothetical protein
MSATWSTRAGEPSSRVNDGTTSRSPRIRPTWARIACTTSGAMSSFFTAKGSIDGAMIRTGRSSQSGTYSWREKTHTSACSTYGRTKAHAASVHSLALSMPMWLRQTTDAPHDFTTGTNPAGWGSWTMTMSPGRTMAASS